MNRQSGHTERAERLILRMIEEAKEAGRSSCRVKAGDLQKELGLSNRTPCMCQAMDNVARSGRYVVTTIYASPSRRSTAYELEYRF